MQAKTQPKTSAPDAMPFPIKAGWTRVAGILCAAHRLPVYAHDDGRWACVAGHNVPEYPARTPEPCACGDPTDADFMAHGFPTCLYATPRPVGRPAAKKGA